MDGRIMNSQSLLYVLSFWFYIFFWRWWQFRSLVAWNFIFYEFLKMFASARRHQGRMPSDFLPTRSCQAMESDLEDRITVRRRPPCAVFSTKKVCNWGLQAPDAEQNSTLSVAPSIRAQDSSIHCPQISSSPSSAMILVQSVILSKHDPTQ